MSPPAPEPRPDYRAVARRRRNNRSLDHILAHYLLERSLTDRLLGAYHADRSRVYGEIYSELFSTLSDHPQNTRTPQMNAERARHQLAYLSPYLRRETVFMEVGCGDATIAKAVARKAGTSYGLDVTDALIGRDATPSNFGFVKTDGISVPLPDDTLDLTYSNQLMEHLHEDDAAAQMREIWRTLKPGGRYICITPNRVTGPHDVSCYFDYSSTCFDVKEYDFAQLRGIMQAAGFRKTRFKIASRGVQFPIPFRLGRLLEEMLLAMPVNLRAALSRTPVVSVALGLYVVAVK